MTMIKTQNQNRLNVRNSLQIALLLLLLLLFPESGVISLCPAPTSMPWQGQKLCGARSFSIDLVQVVLGLPAGLFQVFGSPRMMTPRAWAWSCSGSAQVTCPKYCSLLLQILFEIGLSPVLLYTSAFVVSIVYERCRIRFKHHWWLWLTLNLKLMCSPEINKHTFYTNRLIINGSFS